MDTIFTRSGGDPWDPRKNKQREKNPAPGGGTYSRCEPRVKANWPENRPKLRDSGVKANGEERIVSREGLYSPLAIRYSPTHETNGFPGCCPPRITAGQGGK